MPGWRSSRPCCRELKADDPHQMFGVNECASALLCAEMFFKASLERKESLGWFLREDYPRAEQGRAGVDHRTEQGRAGRAQPRAGTPRDVPVPAVSADRREREGERPCLSTRDAGAGPRTLTPEEEALPYSKYYHRPVAPPNPKLMEILNQGPMDPAKALPYERINDLLDPGYHEVETGYCILPNGAGYVAVNNVFPGLHRGHDEVVVRLARGGPGPALRALVPARPRHHRRERPGPRPSCTIPTSPWVRSRRTSTTSSARTSAAEWRTSSSASWIPRPWAST